MTLAPERRNWRIGLSLALFASWLFLLPALWKAFSTVPSPERLKESHMIRIPTLETVGIQAAVSGIELAVLIALLWPWWHRWWVARIWTAALGTTLWFLLTPPLGLTAVHLMHRRWLAAVAFTLLLGAMVATLNALRNWRRMQTGPEQTPRPHSS